MQRATVSVRSVKATVPHRVGAALMPTGAPLPSQARGTARARNNCSPALSSLTSIQRSSKGMVICAGMQNNGMPPVMPLTSPAVQLPRVCT